MSPRTLGRFTADEVAVLADALSVAQWPLPLQVRVTAPTQDAVRRAELAARERLTAGGLLRGGRVEPDLEEALLTLAHPTASVDVTGTCGPGRADVVRVVAAHRGGAVTLAHQLPGPSEQVGGELVLATTTWGALAADLAALLLALLPALPAGRVPAVSLRRHELVAEAPGEGETTVRRHAAPGRVERARAQLAALAAGPLGTAGQVGLTARTPGSPPARRVSLRWLDVLGDGRYLVETSDGAAVTGCDRAVLARALAEQLARPPHPAGAGTPAG